MLALLYLANCMYAYKTIFYFVILTSLISLGSFAQENNFSLGANYHAGYLMAHSDEIKYMVEDNIRGCEVTANWRTTGGDYWHHVYRYPTYGAGFYYSNLANDEHYGKVLGLYSYIKSSIGGSYKPVVFNYQISFGLSYLTKIYDIEDNLLNVAIGTHNNVFIKLNFDVTTRVTEKIYWVNALNFIHFSNGKIQSPNLGFNLGTVSTGFTYQINNVVKPDYGKYADFEPDLKKHNFELYLSAGAKAPAKYIYDRYFVSSLTFDYGYRKRYKRMWGLGVDVFYDRSIKPAVLDKIDTTFTNKEYYKVGFHGMHDVYFGKFVITLQIGYYIYRAYMDIADIYTRTGIKYHLNDYISLKFALKAHYASADFIEWGIGYRW